MSSILKNGLVKILLEVNDGVFEVAIAVWRLAHSTSSVLKDALCSADARVSHVLSSAVLADLELRVAVELGKLCWRDTTLAVQTVNILAGDVLQVVSIHQLNQGHVSLGRVCFHERVVKCDPTLCLLWSHCNPTLFLFLLNSHLLPAARANLILSILGGSVVGDS